MNTENTFRVYLEMGFFLISINISLNLIITNEHFWESNAFNI